MILEKETKTKFGYLSEILSSGSNKEIIISCDYCQLQLISTMKKRNKSHLIVAKDCCSKCKYKKMKEQNIIKYGVENVFQLKDIKDKIKNTVKEKYGTEHWVQSSEFKEKSNNTNLLKYGSANHMSNEEMKNRQKMSVLEKYGVENVSQVTAFQNKRKQTCLKKFGNEIFMSSDIGREMLIDGMQSKYGVSNIFSAKEIKEKIKITNNFRLGCDYPQQNEKVREKSKQTVLDKYGVEFISQSEEIKNKIKSTNLSKYGYMSATKSEIVKNKIKHTMIKNGRFKQFDGKSMELIAKEKDIPYTTFVRYVRKYGIDFALSAQPYENSLEKLMENILLELNIVYQKHNIINGRKCDFYIPEYNILLECDGLFWHSDFNIKDKKYHAIKRKIYLSAGYKSLFFRSNEIEKNPLIIKSMIVNSIKQSVKIFARKCSVGKDKILGINFIKDNHLMGCGKGKIYYLKYNEEIVCAIQIKRNNSKNYEISRFCSKLGCTVVGGFSKLLKQFEIEFSPESIKTYIDLRYGSGSYLKELGFEYKGEFLSFKWTNGEDVFNRMKFPNNAGYDKKLHKIWDCGQAKYIKVYP